MHIKVAIAWTAGIEVSGEVVTIHHVSNGPLLTAIGWF